MSHTLANIISRSVLVSSIVSVIVLANCRSLNEYEPTSYVSPPNLRIKNTNYSAPIQTNINNSITGTNPLSHPISREMTLRALKYAEELNNRQAK